MNPAYIAPALFAAGVACLAFAAVSKPARGAERTPASYDLWLFVKPPAEDRQNVFRIGVAFLSKGDCENAKRAMRKVAGTLQCLPVGDF